MYSEIGYDQARVMSRNHSFPCPFYSMDGKCGRDRHGVSNVLRVFVSRRSPSRRYGCYIKVVLLYIEQTDPRGLSIKKVLSLAQ
jgi:hypothetical protein